MIYKIALSSIILLLLQCTKDKTDYKIDKDGIIINQPYIWRVKVSENGYNGGFVSDPIFDDQGVLLGAQDQDRIDYFIKINIQNGETIWKADYINKTDLFALREAYHYSNFLIEREHNVIYKLDLETGKYCWTKDIQDDAFGWLTGIDSLFFLFKEASYTLNPEYKVYAAYYGNISDGNIYPLVIADLGDLPEPDLSKKDLIGWFRYIKPYKDIQTSEIILLCYYGKNYYLPSSNDLDMDMESQSYLGLYNFSKKTWIYDKIELGEYSWLIGFTPTIIDNRIYHTLDALEGDIAECRDLNTGIEIWRNEGNYQFSDNGFIIADNKMIVIDDLTRSLIALNIENGYEIWKTKTAATCSRIYELNGVIYFIGGSDGKLYAVEVSSGKILWKMESPDYKRDQYDYFKREVKVIPGKAGEKGKIIVSSFTHAYCYEAAR